jgi:CRP-like cAMP-binding protein
MLKKADFIKILQKTFPYTSKEDILALLEISIYQFCPNRTKIIQSGDKKQIVFFILTGMVRGYFINEKGAEKNIFLRPEETLTGSPDTLFKNRASKYTFESILETEILSFDYQRFKLLLKERPNLIQLYIDGLEENVQTLVNRVESLIDKSPEERYEDLLSQNPQFFQTAFNKHIANYLGITPVSLSRIIRRKNGP